MKKPALVTALKTGSVFMERILITCKNYQKVFFFTSPKKKKFFCISIFLPKTICLLPCHDVTLEKLYHKVELEIPKIRILEKET